MSYQLTKAFEAANQNLTFHLQNPKEYWSFTRAHLVYAVVVAEGIKFRFPFYDVKVKVEQPTEVLQTVLSGTNSVFSAIPGESAHYIPAAAITIESLEMFPG